MITGRQDIDMGRLSAVSAELSRTNQELAQLFHGDVARLAAGAEHAQRDPLVLCGLLGGKDVGKSTLINALAEREISRDRDEVGAGTSRPLVYVHEQMVEIARQRLAQVGQATGTVEVQYIPHTADSLRHIVLVDLPDFDSDFQHHLAVVQAVVPQLDRVIWVATPRKIADRAWVAFARDVVKADTNIYFALNKCDELLADEEGWSAELPDSDPEERATGFCRDQQQWVHHVLSDAGYDVAADRLFLIAAAYPDPGLFEQRVATIWDDGQWQRYAVDRPIVRAIARQFSAQVQRLRKTMLTTLDERETREIKRRNLHAQAHQNILRLKQHYEIDHWMEQLSHALSPDYRQSIQNDAFGPAFCQLVAGRLWHARRSNVELADEVMDIRAGRWPLLRVIYWLTRWVIRRIGRTLAGGRFFEEKPLYEGQADLFQVRSRSLDDRIAAVRDRIRTQQAALMRRFELQDQFPEPRDLTGQVRIDLLALPRRSDEAVLARLTADYRPNKLGRLFTWAVLLWFPFVQPVTEGLLEMAAAGTDLTDWVHGAYRVVWALGATQLLKGFAVVVGIYITCLAAIYSRCVRDVHKLRQEGLSGRKESRSGPEAESELSPATGPTDEVQAMTADIDQLLMAEVVVPLFKPFERTADRLADITHRLERLAVQEKEGSPAGDE